MSYLMIIEKTSTGFSAYSPDLPGCVATGRTRKQTLKNMADAIQMHLEELMEDGHELPTPTAQAAFFQVRF